MRAPWMEVEALSCQAVPKRKEVVPNESHRSKHGPRGAFAGRYEGSLIREPGVHGNYRFSHSVPESSLSMEGIPGAC